MIKKCSVNYLNLKFYKIQGINKMRSYRHELSIQVCLYCYGLLTLSNTILLVSSEISALKTIGRASRMPSLLIPLERTHM